MIVGILFFGCGFLYIKITIFLTNFISKLFTGKSLFGETLEIRNEINKKFDEYFWDTSYEYGSYEYKDYSSFTKNMKGSNINIPTANKLDFWIYKLKNNRQRIAVIAPVFGIIIITFIKFILEFSFNIPIISILQKNSEMRLLYNLFKWESILIIFHFELTEVNRAILRLELLKKIKDEL